MLVFFNFRVGSDSLVLMFGSTDFTLLLFADGEKPPSGKKKFKVSIKPKKENDETTNCRSLK